MANFIGAFSGFSVNDLSEAKKFYIETLGFELTDEKMGLTLRLPKGVQVFIYEKENHQPATFTILNLVVEDIDQAMADLKSKGIKFERYDLGEDMKQDDSGVVRGKAANMGPDIAWFEDPAGNVLAVLEE